MKEYFFVHEKIIEVLKSVNKLYLDKLIHIHLLRSAMTVHMDILYWNTFIFYQSTV